MKANMLKSLIASRANSAVGEERFFKSYVKNVKEVARRNTRWHDKDIMFYEVDYTFEYKVKQYRINHDRANSFNGIFTLIEL